MNMGELTELITIILVFSIPLTAIVMGGLNKRHSMNGRSLSKEDRAKVAELAALAEKLGQRVDTLEAILDAEVPNWRAEHERRA